MITFQDKVNSFKNSYIREYGTQKYNKVFSKISNSKKISKLINLSLQKLSAPTKNDFLYSVNEMPFFMFAKADTIAMGALLALEMWHKSLNTEFDFLDEHELNHIFSGLMNDVEKIRF